MGTPSSPLEIDLAETNNTVRIDPPNEEKALDPKWGELSKQFCTLTAKAPKPSSQAIAGRITELKDPSRRYPSPVSAV